MANRDWDDLRRWSREQRERKSSPDASSSAKPEANEGSNGVHGRSGDNGTVSGQHPNPADRRPGLPPEAEQVRRAISDPKAAAGDLTRKAIAEKTGIRLPSGIGKDLRTPGRRGAAAKAGLMAAITAGLTYLGVPPQVSQRIAPIVLSAVSVMLSFSLLLGVGLVGGIAFSSGQDNIEETADFQAIDPRLRDELKNIALTYRLPSRVLIAIAGVQTSYGRYSPYDDIDRDPSRPGPSLADKTSKSEDGTGTYPSTRPSIGSTSVDGQGLGMFLVRPGAAKRARINPQDASRTARWLAELMREEANNLVRSGLDEPRATSTDYSTADEFWGQVISALPLVDPLSTSLRCAAPAGTGDLSVIISTIWNCEVDRQADIAIPSVVGEDQLYVSYNANRSISSQLVSEALGVAWSWGKSRHPEVTTWAELSTVPCQPNARFTGVYPIDNDTAKALGIKDRCDASEVSSAVARAVLGRLREPETPPSVNSDTPYVIEQDAWSVIPFALGNSSAQTKFAQEGPVQPFYPSDACAKLIVIHLSSVSLNPVLRQYFVLLASSGDVRPDTLPGYSEAVALLTGPGAGNPRSDVRCVGRNSKIADGSWIETMGSEADRLYTLLSEGTRLSKDGTVPPEITALRGMADLSAHLFAGYPDALRPAVPGKDAAIPRLSSDQIYVDVPQIGLTTSTVSFGLWQRILSEALRIGGILKGDPRAGTTFQFTAGGGVGIALQREDPGSKPVIPTAEGTVPLPPCGNPNNATEHRTVQQYVQRWMALCSAATAAGVDIAISSSWRSMAEQQYLYNLYGAGRAAQPGFSNHQKGWALDISMDQGQSYSQNSTYAYLHSIVGCLDEGKMQYKQLATALTPESYDAASGRGSAPCGASSLPIKRVQTFGLVPLCTFRIGEDFGSSEVLLCSMETTIRGTGGQIREPWHLDYGIVVVPLSSTPANCNSMVPIDASSRQAVAIAVKTIFYCELAAKGLTAVGPIDGPNYPASKYFNNLAEQVSSEAVLVAFCESGLTPTSGDGSSYVGVFQMGQNEMETFGGNSSARTDARLNITAAARYFLYGWERYGNTGWGGWGPWAVVNTDFWETNRSVLRPAVGRFPSTHPQAEGQYGPDLPSWAIDPVNSWGLSGGCGDYAYAGKPWPTPASKGGTSKTNSD